MQIHFRTKIARLFACIVCTSQVISYNGVTAKEPAQKAELFNEYFCSVFLPAASNVNRAEINISPKTVMEISQKK